MLANHLVGRAEELGSIERVLGELDRAAPGALELVGEPGIGKTRLLTELAARAEQRGQLVLSGIGVGARARPAVLRLRGCAGRVRRGPRPEAARAPRRRRAGASSPTSSRRCLRSRRGREVALQHERYRSHRAVRALLEHLAATKPLVLVLDDLHWADSASVELLGALLRRPPAAAVLMALALRPRQMPERLSAALERAHRAAALTRIELGALTPVEARELLGETVDRRRRNGPLRGERRQPVLSRAARPVARPRRSATTPASEISLTGIGVPSAVAASLSEELALLSDGGTPRARGSGGGGRSVRARAGGGRRGDVRGSGDGRARRAPAARSRPQHRRAPTLPLPAPARPARGLRGHGRRLAAGCARAVRRGARGARGARRRRARTTSSARRARATSPPSRSCARPARQPPGWRRQAPHAGSPPRSGCSRRRRRREERVELLLARAGRAGRDGPFRRQPRARCSRRLAIVPDESIALRARLTTRVRQGGAPPRAVRAGPRAPRERARASCPSRSRARPSR